MGATVKAARRIMNACSAGSAARTRARRPLSVVEVEDAVRVLVMAMVPFCWCGGAALTRQETQGRLRVVERVTACLRQRGGSSYRIWRKSVRPDLTQDTNQV